MISVMLMLSIKLLRIKKTLVFRIQVSIYNMINPYLHVRALFSLLLPNILSIASFEHFLHRIANNGKKSWSDLQVRFAGFFWNPFLPRFRSGMAVLSQVMRCSYPSFSWRLRARSIPTLDYMLPRLRALSQVRFHLV